jgi:hypothetical protein
VGAAGAGVGLLQAARAKIKTTNSNFFISVLLFSYGIVMELQSSRSDPFGLFNFSDISTPD